MSDIQTPDRGSSATSYRSPESLGAPEAGRLPHSETVINPARRAAAQLPQELPPPNSSLCNLLFPALEAGVVVPSPVGVELGHFRILAPIRSGGMGAVFEAHDTRLNRTVALKVLPPNQSRDVGAVERFRNEAQAAAQLDHDNIARVYYIGEDRGLHYIAFEFIRGTNLRELSLQKGKLDPAEAVNYTLQVAMALAHTSSHGVVHRDIKPSNIIITPSGRAKLVDLGLARNENRASEQDLTAAGTTLGTFDYISPEQAKDPRNVDVRSDIYSLGCTLYHLLTGEPPYPEGTVLQKLLDHQGKESPDPRSKNRRVSDGLAVVVRKMMESDPRKRYQTAEQLLHDLFVVAQQLGLRSLSSDRVVWMASQPVRPSLWERHGSWIATAAALLLIVGLIRSGGLTPAPVNEGEAFPALSESQNVQPISPQETGTAADNQNHDAGTESEKGVNSPSIVRAPADFPSETTETRPAPETESAVVQTNAVAPGEPESSISPLRMPMSLLDEIWLRSPESVFPVTSINATHPGPAMAGPQPLTSGPGVNPSIPTQSQDPTVADNNAGASAGTDTKPVTAGNSNTNSGTSEVASNTKTTPNPPIEPSLQPTIALLKSDGTGTTTFPTLEAACAVAQDGNFIELRFNGVRQETPLKISRKITIRAGKGFRPIVEFVPQQIPASGYETRMISVTTGALDLQDVTLQMSVDANIPADQWVLISLQRPEDLRISRCVLSIPNLKRKPATVLEIRGGGMQSAMDAEMPKMNKMQTPLAVDFSETYVCGSADLIQLRSVLSGRLTLKDSLIALRGTLLRAEGASEVSEPLPNMELKLEHVTAVLGDGLLRLQEGPAPRRLGRLLVTSRNNVFSMISEPGALPPAFVEIQGNVPTEDLRQLLLWNGQVNLYDRVQTFWTLTSASGAMAVSDEFDDWQRQWGSNDVSAQVTELTWQKIWKEVRLSSQVPEDFVLDRDQPANSALSEAGNGFDFGVDLSKLSRLITVPPNPEPRVSAPL